jgi:hypothetical protein
MDAGLLASWIGVGVALLSLVVAAFGHIFHRLRHCEGQLMYLQGAMGVPPPSKAKEDAKRAFKRGGKR